MTQSIFLYSIIMLLTALSWFKDRQKTKKALMKAKNMLVKLAPELLAILLFVGLSLSIFTPETISSLIGDQSGVVGVFIASFIGSFAMLPSFVVFPLADTLVDNGAGLVQVSAFIATLVSVGFASLPMERKIFGKEFTYMRNLSAVLMAFVFSFVIWVVLPWL
ncbi:hypothetical protein HMI01_05910 [Halolactibacillus miurensis]|uniref:Permease n=1 Tax=Halolactibacillus miurensis TaxID=306541 RepID=A0A1I6R442_9BACI|nr:MULTISPECIES: hypothetical protein [Halolactibacillus]GEM03603.1 hypothetical protein HMI01_05910 [Halolactibacillus miurensis]SFS59258.1 hypothetical protein SAMN05421668_10584 [Halolactibacillus miurensis]